MAEPPAPDPRQADTHGPSGRAIIAWGAGMLVALALIWFVAAVVVPYWQVRALVLENSPPGLSSYLWHEGALDLGGEERAVAKVKLYLRLPGRLAPRQDLALTILIPCGRPAVPVLVAALSHRAPEVRNSAAYALSQVLSQVPDATEALPALVKALGDKYVGVRYHAALALARLGPGAAEAVPALQDALLDEEESVRFAAAEALKRIRGEGPKAP